MPRAADQGPTSRGHSSERMLFGVRQRSAISWASRILSGVARMCSAAESHGCTASASPHAAARGFASTLGHAHAREWAARVIEYLFDDIVSDDMGLVVFGWMAGIAVAASGTTQCVCVCMCVCVRACVCAWGLQEYWTSRIIFDSKISGTLHTRILGWGGWHWLRWRASCLLCFME